jgi:hypothetical protein
MILACSFLFLFTAIGATLAPSAFCAGPEWVLLDENADSGFYFDKSGTSKQKDGIVRVKTRVVYTEAGRADAVKMMAADKRLTKLYESRYLHDLNCSEKESRLLEATHLDKEGVTLKSTDLSSSTEFEGIPPETRIESVYMRVCTQ